MKLNEHTAIYTPKVLLVPYEAHHVPTYHEWMKSEELQELTASEPLSLEAEYSMQKSWRTDTNKLTFIVCRPGTTPTGNPPTLSPADTVTSIHAGDRDRPEYMIGDVNLFLNKDYEVDENGEDTEQAYVRGEIELMIANPEYRGKGLGRATLLAFLRYIKEQEADIIATFMDGGGGSSVGEELRLGVKIGEDNERSRGLFLSVGFEQVGEPNYFMEVELRLLDWGRVEEVDEWTEVRYGVAQKS